MYNSKHVFFLLLLISLAFQVIWARCICDPADSACLNSCVNNVQNCIVQCNKSNGSVCRNDCIKTYWSGASPQGIHKLEGDEIATTEIEKGEVSNFDNVLAEPENTVEKPVAAAYAPVPTPQGQGVMGQLIPFLVTALGGNEPYMKGQADSNGQTEANSNGQTNPYGQPGAGLPNKGGNPYVAGQSNPNEQPNMNRQPKSNGQSSANEQPGQPNAIFPGQPNLNGQPNMNGQPNLNGHQPGVNAQPTIVAQPTAPLPGVLPLPVATDPSLLTTHTTVLSLTTVTPNPSAVPSFIPSNIFHLSQGVKHLVDPSSIWLIGLVLLFTTYNLI